MRRLDPWRWVVKGLSAFQLRSAIDAARNALGLPPISCVDVAITPGDTTIKKDYVLLLRTGTQ